MRLAVIGTGYVGLVTGSCLSDAGHDVVCVDIDKAKVAKLKKGQIPIYEPSLREVVVRNSKAGRLHFTSKLTDIEDPDAIFFALPTPPDGDGKADLRFVLKAAEDVAKTLKTYTVLINKSTVPVGTAQKVNDLVASHTDVAFDVVSNPEFLREGFAVSDFMKPDRIVVGTSSPRARVVMEEIYLPFTAVGAPLIFMDEASSEITKYAANSFLAAKITFMNEIANVCERVGANVDFVKAGVGADERIGSRFLNAGIGYGGSCFPKDVLAMHKTAAEYHYDFKMLDAIMRVNTLQKQLLVHKLLDRFGNNLKGRVFAVWGLAFKPDTDDIREAPSLEIIKLLIKKGARVQAYDPEAMPNVRKIIQDHIVYGRDAVSVLKDADALLIVAEWKEFAAVKLDEVARQLKHKIVFDGRNIFELDAMQDAGFEYISIGRQTVGTPALLKENFSSAAELLAPMSAEAAL